MQRQQLIEKRTKQAMNVIDIVDDIERIREKASELKNSDAGFLQSLGVVLNELKDDDLKQKTSKNYDSLDNLKDSFHEFRNTGFSQKYKIPFFSNFRTIENNKPYSSSKGSKKKKGRRDKTSKFMPKVQKQPPF